MDDEPVVVKEANLGKANNPQELDEKCFDDGINCDATWDVSEPAVDTRKNVNPKVLKEANVGKAEKITEEQ